MTLRARLFLTSLVVAVPLAVGWFLFDSHLRLGTKEQELRRSVEFDVANGLQERCEADPPRAGRPGRGGVAPPRPARPGPEPPGAPPGAGPDPGRNRGGGPRRPGRGGSGAYEFFAYDASGRPSAPDAPPLPADRDGSSATTYWTGTGRGVAVVVPLGGGGPCAFLLARIPPRQGELRDQAQALALVIISVLAAAWIAAGPIIARLRHLAEDVRRSAASHYADPVSVQGQDEMAALAGAFNEAGQSVRAHLMDIQAREQALRGFVANTTHDVAIPLTVLQGHLAELDRELTTPQHQERVRAAMQEAHYMASLLRNLATATTLDEPNAPVVSSPVDLSALVERVVARHRPVARTSGVELNAAVPDPALVVPSDHTLLEQALSNLVDNAIRYNRAGGHVAVLLDRADGGFALSVTDDGPGVTDEELAQLTTRWFRGSEARTRRPDGHGLGLAIAAEACRRLGLSLTFSKAGDTGLRAEIRRAPVRS
jgi:two-component system, OmpR family, sensor histidine kinase BaeS